MFIRKFLSLLCTGVLVFSLTACSDDSEDKSTLAPIPGEMQSAIDGAFNALNHAFDDAYGSLTKEINKGGGDISYSVAGEWSASGSYSYSDVYPYYPITCDIHFVFISFTDEEVTLQNGTADISMTMTSQTAASLRFTGDFDIVYSGEVYSLSWDVTMTINNTAYTYNGICSIDGTTYSYSGTAK